MKWINGIGLLLIFLGTTVVYSQDAEAYLPINMHNIDSLEIVATFDIDTDGNRNGISTLQFHPLNGVLYSVEFNESIRTWDMDSFEFIETLNLPTEYVTTFSIHPDGELLIYGGWDIEAQPDFTTLNRWEIDQRENELLLRQGDEGINEIAFSPDGGLFAVVELESPVIQIWTTETFEQVALLSGHNEPVNHIAFLTNEQLISSGDDGQVHIWDVNNGVMLHTFEGHFFVSHPSEQSLLISTENEFQIIHLSESGMFEAIPYSISGSPFAFNPAGDILAVVEEGEVWLYDFQEGERIRSVGGYFGNFPPPIAFSSDGYFLATPGSPLGSVSIWAVPVQ